jgi:hypothetical protein
VGRILDKDFGYKSTSRTETWVLVVRVVVVFTSKKTQTPIGIMFCNIPVKNSCSLICPLSRFYDRMYKFLTNYNRTYAPSCKKLIYFIYFNFFKTITYCNIENKNNPGNDTN